MKRIEMVGIFNDSISWSPFWWRNVIIESIETTGHEGDAIEEQRNIVSKFGGNLKTGLDEDKRVIHFVEFDSQIRFLDFKEAYTNYESNS